jgi:hypothetical protein
MCVMLPRLVRFQVFLGSVIHHAALHALSLGNL